MKADTWRRREQRRMLLMSLFLRGSVMEDAYLLPPVITRHRHQARTAVSPRQRCHWGHRWRPWVSSFMARVTCGESRQCPAQSPEALPSLKSLSSGRAGNRQAHDGHQVTCHPACCLTPCKSLSPAQKRECPCPEQLDKRLLGGCCSKAERFADPSIQQ